MVSERSLVASWSVASKRKWCKTFSIDIFSMGNILDFVCPGASQTSSPEERNIFLVNPANEGLVGIQYPNFRAGGFQASNDPRNPPFRSPSAGTFSWCRAPDVTGSTGIIMGGKVDYYRNGTHSNGSRAFYGSECVDGLVHRACGEELETYLRATFPVLTEYESKHDVRCPPGGCRWSPSFGDLVSVFPQGILHIVPPFKGWIGYGDLLRLAIFEERSRREDKGSTVGVSSDMELSWIERLRTDCSDEDVLCRKLLKQCYISALHEAIVRRVGSIPGDLTLVAPFAGTGVRGFGLEEGVRLAAGACRRIADKDFSETLIVETQMELGNSGQEICRDFKFAFVTSCEGAMLFEVVKCFHQVVKEGSNFERVF